VNKRKRKAADQARVTSLEFFAKLKWLDGRPLLDTMEPYRRELFSRALDTYDADGVPQYNFVLCGRGKKNYKSTDLVLSGFHCLLVRESAFGNDGYIVANDLEQADNDLAIAKKLIRANPELASELVVLQEELRRRDGGGSLRILPARDIAGAHGKTYNFLGFDEIHVYRSYDLIEALSPDPHRPDALRWIATYDGLFTTRGIPLVDFKMAAKAGDDPRMLASWYSGDWCTDPNFADLAPEQRANPSMESWPQGQAYLDQQKRLLPTHKYRRLHLNLPGSPEGAFFDQGKVLAVISTGRSMLRPQDEIKYHAFVDMSGGSSDDAVLAIGHDQDGVAVVDSILKQSGPTPFNPRNAITKFAEACREYRVSKVTGDNFAGNTFKADFDSNGITYQPCRLSKSDLYEALEPAINAGEVELPDHPILQEQLLTLVVRGARVDHQSGDHDDHPNAAAGVVHVIRESKRGVELPQINVLHISAPDAISAPHLGGYYENQNSFQNKIW
jgi:hypothetical protein